MLDTFRASLTVLDAQVLAGAKLLYTCMLVDIHKVAPGYTT